MSKTGIIEMTGQPCFEDNTAAPELIPMRLISCFVALFISCDRIKSQIRKHRREEPQIPAAQWLLSALFRVYLRRINICTNFE